MEEQSTSAFLALSVHKVARFFKENKDATSILNSFSRLSSSLFGGTGRNLGSLKQGILYQDDVISVEFVPRSDHVRFLLTIAFRLDTIKRVLKPEPLGKALKDIEGLWIKIDTYLKEWLKVSSKRDQEEPNYDTDVKISPSSKGWRDHVAKEHKLAKQDVHAVVRSLALAS